MWIVAMHHEEILTPLIQSLEVTESAVLPQFCTNLHSTSRELTLSQADAHDLPFRNHTDES